MGVDPTGPAQADEPDEEPDYRFTLANERTYLAWIRTSLAFVAGAIAIVQFVPHFGFAGGSRLIGVGLAAIGGAVAVLAWYRWRRVQLAMRRGEDLPPTPLPMIVGLVVVIAVVVVLLVFALDRQ